MPPRAIETRYKGYRFRSRLEARWAVFFDALGLRWEYEPEGFELNSGRYLPDFKVHYPGRDSREAHSRWFECKGDLRAVTHNEWERMIEFQRATGLIVLDGTPDFRMYLRPGAIVSPDGEDFVGAEEFVDPAPTPYKAQPHALAHEREGAALWCSKGRLWWDAHCCFFYSTPYPGCNEPLLENAVAAARSARFEHGERGGAR